MAASASGVSKTRSSPNSAWSRSVTRNTPPSVPTSSPKRRTRGSSRKQNRRASLRAWTIVTSARTIRLLLDPKGLSLLALTGQLGSRLGEHPPEKLLHTLRGHGDDFLPQPGHEAVGLVVHPHHEGLVGERLTFEEPLVPFDGVPSGPLVDLVRGSITCRVVSGRVGPDPVG